MTVLRFKRSYVTDAWPYPETAKWIADNVPLGHAFELETIEDRTLDEHRWFFAVVKKVFQNLPERAFDNPKHLRKRALIEAGWYVERLIDASHVSIIMCDMLRWIEPYLVFHNYENGKIGIRRAKSMKFKKNGGELTKEKYREVVERALVWMSGLIGVDAAELLREVPEEFR